MVPLDQVSRRWFDSYLAYWETVTLNSQKSLFVNIYGNPLNGRSIQRFYQQITLYVGFKITAHDMRHTAVRRLQREGKKPQTLQKFLGHANIETTFKNYLHLTEEEYLADF